MTAHQVRRPGRIAIWLGLPALALILAAGVLVAGGPRGQSQAAAVASPAATPVLTTDLLGYGLPQSLPGQALQLIRYTLPVGGTTQPHTRPGIRVSFVAQGAYGFTLLSGRAEVWRAGVDRRHGQPEPLQVGTEYVFRPGDAIFLDEGVVSRARSLGPEPLVLWQAALAPAANLTTTVVPAGTPGT